MAMVYQWKEIGAPGGVEAQVAGEEMERIRVRNNGRLDARGLVEASRPVQAPLHPAFEWNDARAAEHWRENQASHMIRHIDVVVERDDREARPIRAFVSVKRDDDRSYTSIDHALGDNELRAQVLRQAWAELEAWRARYAELLELGKVFSLIDQARSAE